MLLGDWGELLDLEVALSLGLGEVAAGPPWDSRRAGKFSMGVIRFSVFQAGLQVALDKSLNLSDIYFVPRMFKSISLELTAEPSML